MDNSILSSLCSYELYRTMCLVYTILILCLSSIKPAYSELDHVDIKFFDFSTSYTVETTILLNDINKRDKEVSYKLNSALNVYPIWREQNTEFLLKFQVSSIFMGLSLSL